MRNAAVLFALGVTLATGAQAQVFKCPGPGGKMIYADRPCDQGHGVTMLERERTFEDIAAERAVAADAEQRKYRARQDAREQQMVEHQMRLSSQQAAARNPTPTSAPGDSPACKAARKELDFVSSIRTVSQDEKRLRTNAAISNVNAACGSNTQLMQEPVKIINKPGHFVDQHGRSCVAHGNFAQCH